MTLSLAALGLASPSEEDSNEVPPPLHLMVPVDLRKGLGGKSFYLFSALIDSGATYNFISHVIAERLSLEVIMAGQRRKQRKLPPPITTVNGETLHATVVVHQMILMRDNTVAKQSHAIHFVVADIAYYDIILNMA